MLDSVILIDHFNGIDSATRFIDEERRRALSDIEVVNQRGETVAVAQHIIKWVLQA